VTKEDMGVISQYLKFEGQDALVDRALAVLKKPTFRARLKGCAECSHTGYAGEMPIAEVLPGSREVRSLFSQSEHKLDFAKLSAHRLNSLAESALNLIEQGECEHSAIFV
jgi:type II secretory ATPase GspE/PulE/Tfp pilus assembly ATPase PilB-like protein